MKFLVLKLRHLLALIGALIAVVAHAGHIETIDCNIDAYNLTGQTANDFDIRLGGVSAAEVRKVYQSFFPNVTVTDESYGALIHYFGLDVAPGERVHIGYEISPSGPVGTIDQYWSYNGARLGAPDFLCNKPTSFRNGNVTNTSTSDLWIQRRVQIQADPVDLQTDLIVGSAFWASASVIDSTPISLVAGSTASYIFADEGKGAYAMIFDVCGDAACSSLRETVFSAVYYTPEPGAMSLLAVAGLAALGGSRLRRRQAA